MHDFGCAFGNLVHSFQKLGIRATGNDFNKALIDAGNKYCKGTLTSEPLERALENLSHPVDFLYSSHVLEHLREPLKALKTIKEHLSPEGILYLALPNSSSLKVLQNGLHDLELYIFPAHLHYFTPKSLVALVREAGLEPLSISTQWLPEFLGPTKQVFERLFGIYVEDSIVSLDSWKNAICENLLGGNLFMVAGHPSNKAFKKRMSDIDRKVEKAQWFGNLLLSKRRSRKRMPSSIPGRLSAMVVLVFRSVFRGEFPALLKTSARLMRNRDWKALKHELRVAYESL